MSGDPYIEGWVTGAGAPNPGAETPDEYGWDPGAGAGWTAVAGAS